MVRLRREGHDRRKMSFSGPVMDDEGLIVAVYPVRQIVRWIVAWVTAGSSAPRSPRRSRHTTRSPTSAGPQNALRATRGR
jgi:hypothetical protein